MPPLSVPTTSALPPSQRIPSTNPGVFRILNRLSRASLLSLVLDWLDDRNQALSAPYLLADQFEDDNQDLYLPSQSIEELREYYSELQGRKGSKRDIVDRVIEGDWRNGLSLYQLAMADMQYLYDHPLSQKWTALKVVQVRGEKDKEEGILEDLPSIPRFHPATFLQNLQREVLPDVKAHYNLDRPSSLPLLILRIFVLDSPYITSLAIPSSGNDVAALDASKTIYIAFPDASPHIFVSLATALPSSNNSIASVQDMRSLRKLILNGIPKAFSRPRLRYALQSTSLAVRSLETMVSQRGAGRTTAASGGWGLYAENDKEVRSIDTPLNNQLPTPPPSGDEDSKISNKILQRGMKRHHEDDESAVFSKKRMAEAKARFGNSGKYEDRKGIERLDIRLEDPFPAMQSTSTRDELELSEDDLAFDHSQPVDTVRISKGRRSTILEELEMDRTEHSQDGWIPDVRVTFHGNHIFAGIRELLERGVIDGKRMPGWMTGEEGVSVGVVRDGRIKGFKGSGI